MDHVPDIETIIKAVPLRNIDKDHTPCFSSGTRTPSKGAGMLET